jgi:hypothetical protein
MYVAAWAAWLGCLGTQAHAQGQAQPQGQSQAQGTEPQPEGVPQTQTVQIQAGRFRSHAGKASLSGDELSRVPGSGGDPMKALQSLPGVAMVDDTSGEPAVRGARPSDNAYLVDFLPVGYLFHVGGFASVFNPDLIRRFNLASAAWSPEYPNVVGAVFDVALREPRSDRLGGHADFSLLGANVLAEGPLGDGVSFFLAARRSWFDLVAKTGEDKEEGVTFTMPVYTDTQGRVQWTLGSAHRVRLDFSTASDRIAFTVAPGAKAAEREPVLAGNSAQHQSYNSVAVVWETDIDKRISHTVALGRMARQESAQLGSAGRLALQTSTTYLRQRLQIAASREHEVTLGGSLQSTLVDLDLDFKNPRCTEFDPNCDITSAARQLSSQTSRQNAADLYLSDRWQMSRQWAATAGLRYSHDAYLKQSATEPRLGLEWSLSSDTTVSAGWGRHSQAPAMEQSLRDIGNPQLRPLQSTHAVLGVTQVLAAGWSLRAEAYAKTFDRYAVSDPVSNYRNGASGSAQGLELLVKKEAVGAFSGFASLSLSRARRHNDSTGESFPFDFDQPVIASLVGQYKLSERWQFGAKWSFHTGAPFTPVVGTGLYPDGRVRPVYSGINSERVPDYHRLDLRADASFTPRLVGYAELINAYARKNVVGYSYSADYSEREAVLQLPMLVSFGIKYKF